MIGSDVKDLQGEKCRFLSGTGEMATLTRKKDWSQTYLGHPGAWPQSLKTTIGIILNSKFPMFLWWGSELTCFYNDAYRASLGKNGKHPGILGMPAQQAWPEIWDIIKPLIDQVLAGGEATWSEDQLIPIFRNGKIEDVYWTFSYSPVNDETGKIAGVLVTCNETTGKVNTLIELEERKNELEFAINAAELGTFDYNPLTNKFSANSRLKEWFGLPSTEELELQLALDAIEEKDREKVAAAIKDTLNFSSGGNYDIEYSIINPVTKTKTIVNAKGKAWFNEDKIPYRFNGTLEDVTGKTLARRKIEESEQRFEAAIAAVKGILWTNNATGEMEGEQLGWAALTGQRYEEYQGYGWANAVHPDDAQGTINAWNKAVEERKTFLYEHRVKTQQGDYREFSIRAIPLLNSDGTIREWVGVHTDITEEKKAQVAIAESEERFRTMAENTAILIALSDETSNASYFNSAWVKLTGRPMEQLLKFGWVDLLHPDDRDDYLNIYLDAFKKKEPFTGEFRILNKEGEYKWLLAKGPPRFRVDGSFAGYISSCIDITERKKAEEELKEMATNQVVARKKMEATEKEFRLLADSLPEMVWTTDAKGNQIFASKKWKDFTGLDPYDVTTFAKMVHPADLENTIKVWSECLASGKAYKTQLRLKSKNGSYQWFYVNGEPIRNQNGDIEKWAGAFTNINEQKITEEELQLTFQKIEESETRLRMAMQLTKLGTWEYNPISGELNWSDECKDIYGLPEGTAIDFQVFAEHIYPTDREYVEGAIQHSMDSSGDGKYDISYRIIRFNDNAVRWIRATGKVYFNVAQQAERFIGTVLDITDQKLSQEILEESEQRSRLAIEAASMGTFDWDLVTNEFISSQRLNDIFGFSGQANITHKNLLDAFHPEDKPRRDEAVKKAGAEGSLSYEARIIWPDQSIHWVKVYGKVLYNSQQQPLRMYGTAIDITDEKTNTTALEENTARLNIAIESAELGAWELNLKTREPYYSERYLEMMGYQKDETPDHEALISKIHPDDLPLRNEAIKKAMENGFLDIEMRIRPDTNTIRWIKARGKTFYDENGIPEKMLGTLMDITETKKTLSILQESEERFRNVANSAPVFIWMAGTDKLRNFFNLAWLKFTGRTMEQEKGYGWTEGVHPEDFNKCVNYYIESFDTQEEFYMEYRLKRQDGEYRWMSARAVPRFTSTGIFEGYIGACMDINEQVVYQKKLKEDEERLNIIINASELGTWELNLKTKGAAYSDRCLQILGYSNRSKASHEKILMQFHPDDLIVRTRAFKRALITGVLFFEARVSWSDHSIHWIESKGKVFYDDNNDPSHIIGTLRDITEQKYYQQELEDREKKFRLLADSMPELVWTGDIEGNLNYFNQSVYDYTGLTPQQMNKEGWLQIVHPDDREENMRLWLESVGTGKDFLFEHRFRRQDGEYNWQLSRAVPQRDAEGNILMWVGTSTNIQQIKEQDQQKDLFISMASHELKTPVTSIKGYVQILQSMYAGGHDKFLKSSLDIVDRQIITLTKLISELLDLSKIKSGSLVLNQENFDLNELIKDKIDEIKHINAAKSISFSKKGNPVVYADRDRIGQVLINFLTNAVKYSPDTLKIKVRAAVKDNNVIVSVEDSGIGINKADQEKIFQRFYRVEGKNEKTFPGFGIGLFIAAEIIKRHNGKIGVESEPGKGSVFYFSLPVLNPL